MYIFQCTVLLTICRVHFWICSLLGPKVSFRFCSTLSSCFRWPFALFLLSVFCVLFLYRTLKPLWEKRVSPNVIYSTHHMTNDTSILAVGGRDGVLRILNQSTGEILKCYIVDSRVARSISSKPQNQNGIEKKKAVSLAEDMRLDVIPRSSRPPITCLAVGMKKVVTTHGENFVRLWRFSQ
jgi:hypothetical protein